MPNLKLLPNFLTVFRIVLSILLFIFLFNGLGGVNVGEMYRQNLTNYLSINFQGDFLFELSLYAKIGVLATVLIIVLSDFLDGFIARQYNLKSDFGAIIDPIADKFFILGTYLFFVYIGFLWLPFWVLLSVREIGITMIRFYLLKKGFVIPAEKGGKIKTATQMLAVIICFYCLLFIPNLFYNLNAFLKLSNYQYNFSSVVGVVDFLTIFIGIGLIYVSIFLSLKSGLGILKKLLTK